LRGVPEFGLFFGEFKTKHGFRHFESFCYRATKT
jgi:hypothetical protein